MITSLMTTVTTIHFILSHLAFIRKHMNFCVYTVKWPFDLKNLIRLMLQIPILLLTEQNLFGPYFLQETQRLLSELGTVNQFLSPLSVVFKMLDVCQVSTSHISVAEESFFSLSVHWGSAVHNRAKFKFVRSVGWSTDKRLSW